MLSDGISNEDFPSPCGVLVLKFVRQNGVAPIAEDFPSPCGVLVLKSALIASKRDEWEELSVPLRGSGS